MHSVSLTYFPRCGVSCFPACHSSISYTTRERWETKVRDKKNKTEDKIAPGTLLDALYKRVLDALC